MRSDSGRKIIVDRLQADLVGPLEAEEVISDLPSDRYLTGILFPPKTAIGADQADEAEVADDDPDGASGLETSSIAATFRPSAAGLSFTVRTSGDGVAAVKFEVSAGRYVRIGSEPTLLTVEQSRCWQRVPLKASFEEFLDPQDRAQEVNLAEHGIPGLLLHLRIRRWQDFLLVTAALVNANILEKHSSRDELEEHTYFQVSLGVSVALGGELVPKPTTRRLETDDPEAAKSALIYRDAGEFAVGHTCSADWVLDEGRVSAVRTQWLPGVVVKKTVETGDAIFNALREKPKQLPLNTRWLSEAPPLSLIEGLRRVSELYGKWIDGQRDSLAGLEERFVPVGRENLQTCRNALERIEAGIKLIEKDADVRAAFQLANRAIWLQSRWKSERSTQGVTDLSWRPFQLAFVLLCLCPTANADDKHRDTMDLLWFPTGGGKTEAYLLLTAFAVFLRRIRANGDPSGAGVTAFMRYTLRLLTIQQFQRAASLVVACDLIRRGAEDGGIAKRPAHFNTDPPISIGLWVGDASTPNKIAKAIEALDNNSPSTPKQLSNCPVCDSELSWEGAADRSRILVHCHAENCSVGKLKVPLPIWTVDEDIYREKPTLVIGTADKYVQLPRNKDTGLLFGIGSNVGPPDLIIQDELHLISGPLGTMAGLYEIAVDELSSRRGVRPKVIGSTATIRRAESQIRALFNRAAFQFPPPGLDHSNSGFATLDQQDPGRLCMGVTTAGRSAKFALQAVAASLLQSATSDEVPDGSRDEYATLVTYFNSLRELGGALVLMRDDVNRSISEYAARRHEEARQLKPPVELTSRVTSSEIPDLLGRLELDFHDDDSVDAVLATNMISVGVDVSRLGAMIVNGQPKGIAEYIQASSRVGRGRVPGLVVTVYNANKARDRSRYEAFAGWHQSLYRDVEATSVTPFAPRARDRAIHAVLVAIVRHTIPEMAGEPIDAADHEAKIRAVIGRIVERARDVDEEEAHAVGEGLHEFLERWVARGRIKYYWHDQSDQGLLISAEKAAERALERRSARWATASPNSLRSVEPSSAFVLAKEQLPRRDQ